jgi:YegS/Rv2252/BmrU family lipid kinase
VNLVLLGGDGSMNAAINAIQDFSRVRLGQIPAGSANDLAKDFGISASPEHVRTILEGRVRRCCDLGEMILHGYRDENGWKDEEKRLKFVVSGGIGWDANVTHNVDISPMKKVLNSLRLGKLSYVIEAVPLILNLRTFRCEINTGDSHLAYDDCMFIAAMNHRFEGGGFMFGPNARDNDGLLNLCVTSRVTVMKFFRLIPVAYQGRQFEYDIACEVRGSSFRIRTDQPLWIHTDGESHWQAEDVTVRIAEEKLQLLF